MIQAITFHIIYLLIKDDNAHLTATISVSGGDICAESVVNLKEQSHKDMPAMFRTCIGITSLRGSVKKQTTKHKEHEQVFYVSEIYGIEWDE